MKKIALMIIIASSLYAYYDKHGNYTDDWVKGSSWEDIQKEKNKKYKEEKERREIQNLVDKNNRQRLKEIEEWDKNR